MVGARAGLTRPCARCRLQCHRGHNTLASLSCYFLHYFCYGHYCWRCCQQPPPWAYHFPCTLAVAIVVVVVAVVVVAAVVVVVVDDGEGDHRHHQQPLP